MKILYLEFSRKSCISCYKKKLIKLLLIFLINNNSNNKIRDKVYKLIMDWQIIL